MECIPWGHDFISFIASTTFKDEEVDVRIEFLGKPTSCKGGVDGVSLTSINTLEGVGIAPPKKKR